MERLGPTVSWKELERYKGLVSVNWPANGRMPGVVPSDTNKAGFAAKRRVERFS